MPHKWIETTMKYYVCQDSDDVADELWAITNRFEMVKSPTRHPKTFPGNITPMGYFKEEEIPLINQRKLFLFSGLHQRRARDSNSPSFISPGPGDEFVTKSRGIQEIPRSSCSPVVAHCFSLWR
jgi:hypothetical protein